jgi:hypothetical protein
MNWLKDKIFPAIIIAVMFGLFGFFVDFQVLKANVKTDRMLIMEVRDDVKHIKKYLTGLE